MLIYRHSPLSLSYHNLDDVPYTRFLVLMFLVTLLHIFSLFWWSLSTSSFYLNSSLYGCFLSPNPFPSYLGINCFPIDLWSSSLELLCLYLDLCLWHDPLPQVHFQTWLVLHLVPWLSTFFTNLDFHHFCWTCLPWFFVIGLASTPSLFLTFPHVLHILWPCSTYFFYLYLNLHCQYLWLVRFIIIVFVFPPFFSGIELLLGPKSSFHPYVRSSYSLSIYLTRSEPNI